MKDDKSFNAFSKKTLQSLNHKGLKRFLVDSYLFYLIPIFPLSFITLISVTYSIIKRVYHLLDIVLHITFSLQDNHYFHPLRFYFSFTI